METLFADRLRQAIEHKAVQVGVIGLGYVGLPLAVTIAEAGFPVLGFDVQKTRVDYVNQGINYIGDVVGGTMQTLVVEERLRATVDFSQLNGAGIIIICVPTPLDKHLQPYLHYIISSAKQVAGHLRDGALVILESTTYPGTTEEILLPILEGRWQDAPELLRGIAEAKADGSAGSSGSAEKGRRCGRDFFLAYSPERVDPGNRAYKTHNTPKVVGGVTASCTELAAHFYRAVLEAEVYKVSSPKVAEMEKLLENIFRLVNIGLINEMAILCKNMNIDIWEVIEAAKTKPYGFMPFYPGPGLGGHCIPIDPYYLTYKAREYGLQTRLIETAGEINRQMPGYVVAQSVRILNNAGIPARGAKILLTGVAYKADVDDWRESPALEIIEQLVGLGAAVDYHDPYIPTVKLKNGAKESLALTADLLAQADLCLIATDHRKIDYQLIREKAKRIFDTRNVMSRLGLLPAGGEYHKL